MAGKIYTPPKTATITSLACRLGVVFGLVAASVLVLWWEARGEGLIDHTTDKPPSLLGCVYFAMVTITTVGYGDITPVKPLARMVDTFFLVPIRFIVLFTFLGTAYQIVIQRFQEEVRMKRAVSKLNHHVIVCGYGATGRAATQELLLQGTPKEQVVVLDMDEEALKDASDIGVVAILGDATQESVLKSVAAGKAASVLIAPGRDDTAVLIALTAHDLHPEARIIASCRQEENVKLLQRSGAHVIVSPATAGGNLMAAATRRERLAETMQDILSFAGAMKLDVREVLPAEIGKHPSQLQTLAAVRVYRGDRHFNVGEFPVLEEGDELVFVAMGKHPQSA